MPKDGAELVVPSSPGGQLRLGFDPGSATVSRRGNDLVFELEGGEAVIIANFFAVGNFGFPTLRLPDGSVVPGLDFFSGRDIDLTPAAGPRLASGGTHYEDDPGELVGGLDRLDAQEASSWDREPSSSPANPPSAGENASARPSPEAEPADGPPAPEESPPSSGGGGEIFLFALLDEERPREILEDFVLHEDVLRFEGLIDGRDANVLTDQLQASLSAAEGDPGKLSLDAVTEEGLLLSIGGRALEVRFEEAGRLSEDQVLALQSEDIQSQIEVLKLLFGTTG
jgi:hypothetical protein